MERWLGEGLGIDANLNKSLTTHASVVFDATHLQVGLSLTQQPIISSLNVSQ